MMTAQNLWYVIIQNRGMSQDFKHLPMVTNVHSVSKFSQQVDDGVFQANLHFVPSFGLALQLGHHNLTLNKLWFPLSSVSVLTSVVVLAQAQPQTILLNSTLKDQPVNVYKKQKI